MRIAGSILCTVGLFFLILAAAYDPSAASSIGRTLNLGLLINQLSYAVVGVGLITAGCALIAGGAVVAALNGHQEPARAEPTMPSIAATAHMGENRQGWR